jgi:hypothetical protein
MSKILLLQYAEKTSLETLLGTMLIVYTIKITMTKQDVNDD